TESKAKPSKKRKVTHAFFISQKLQLGIRNIFLERPVITVNLHGVQEFFSISIIIIMIRFQGHILVVLSAIVCFVLSQRVSKPYISHLNSITGTSFTVRWDPARIANQDIIRYDVETRGRGLHDQSKVKSIPGNQHSLTVDNLSPYTGYTVLVSAVTRSGLKISGYRRPVLTDTASPNAPVNLEIIQIHPKSVVIEWQPPKFFYKKVDLYEAEIFSEVQGRLQVRSTRNTKMHLRGLNPNERHFIRVRAATRSLYSRKYYKGDPVEKLFVTPSEPTTRSPTKHTERFTTKSLDPPELYITTQPTTDTSTLPETTNFGHDCDTMGSQNKETTITSEKDTMSPEKETTSTLEINTTIPEKDTMGTPEIDTNITERDSIIAHKIDTSILEKDTAFLEPDRAVAEEYTTSSSEISTSSVYETDTTNPEKETMILFEKDTTRPEKNTTNLPESYRTILSQNHTVVITPSETTTKGAVRSVTPTTPTTPTTTTTTTETRKPGVTRAQSRAAWRAEMTELLWLKTASRNHQAQTRLANVQAEVAALQKVKLQMEIAKLRNEL
ncbi:hypothetical protein EGW08_004830, partial [Elysia chlorotica]